MEKRILDMMFEVGKTIALKNDCVNDSNFSVVCVLLTKSGKIYFGHNIENFGIQATCGERSTFAKALSNGEKEFVGMLGFAYPKNEGNFVDAWPCGYCREFLSKFVGEEFEVYTIDENQDFILRKMKDLVPLKDISANPNYKLDDNAQIRIVGNDYDIGLGILLENINEDNELLKYAKKASINSNNYIEKEGAAILGINEKGEKVIYIGATQTDMNGSIIKASKSALIAALTDGVKKFEKVVNISMDGDKYKTTSVSYDVIQLMLQYCGKEFKLVEYDEFKDCFYYKKIEEVLPNSFVF